MLLQFQFSQIEPREKSEIRISFHLDKKRKKQFDMLFLKLQVGCFSLNIFRIEPVKKINEKVLAVHTVHCESNKLILPNKNRRARHLASQYFVKKCLALLFGFIRGYPRVTPCFPKIASKLTSSYLCGRPTLNPQLPLVPT